MLICYINFLIVTYKSFFFLLKLFQPAFLSNLTLDPKSDFKNDFADQ